MTHSGQLPGFMLRSGALIHSGNHQQENSLLDEALVQFINGGLQDCCDGVSLDSHPCYVIAERLLRYEKL